MGNERLLVHFLVPSCAKRLNSPTWKCRTSYLPLRCVVAPLRESKNLCSALKPDNRARKQKESLTQRRNDATKERDASGLQDRSS